MVGCGGGGGWGGVEWAGLGWGLYTVCVFGLLLGGLRHLSYMVAVGGWCGIGRFDEYG